jgi:hypothetical protein
MEKGLWLWPLPWKNPRGFACRFALSQERSTQDKVARELQDAGLLAHGEQREPRGISFADLRKLPYLEAVRWQTNTQLVVDPH